MMSFITTVFVFVMLFFLGMAIYKAIAQVAEHVRRTPEAGKALYDHLFMPLFSDSKQKAGGDDSKSGPSVS